MTKSFVGKIVWMIMARLVPWIPWLLRSWQHKKVNAGGYQIECCLHLILHYSIILFQKLARRFFLTPVFMTLNPLNVKDGTVEKISLILIGVFSPIEPGWYFITMLPAPPRYKPFLRKDHEWFYVWLMHMGFPCFINDIQCFTYSHY